MDCAVNFCDFAPFPVALLISCTDFSSLRKPGDEVRQSFQGRRVRLITTTEGATIMTKILLLANKPRCSHFSCRSTDSYDKTPIFLRKTLHYLQSTLSL